MNCLDWKRCQRKLKNGIAFNSSTESHILQCPEKGKHTDTHSHTRNPSDISWPSFEFSLATASCCWMFCSVLHKIKIRVELCRWDFFSISSAFIWFQNYATASDVSEIQNKSPLQKRHGSDKVIATNSNSNCIMSNIRHISTNLIVLVSVLVWDVMH